MRIPRHKNTTSAVLALRTPEQYQKVKRYDTEKNSPDRQLPNMLLEKGGEIAPEGMNRLSQSGNNTQLWVCLVVKVKSDAVKNNIAQELEMLGP